MRKVISYIAISLNGKIARTDGEVDWLDIVSNPEKVDYGFHDFYDSIDITIQGYNTYQKILDWGVDFPYKGKDNYVVTRKSNVKDNEDVTFIAENHIDRINQLKKQGGKDIWLVGGGNLNATFLNNGLIDEIRVYVMPVVIPGGLELFDGLEKDHEFKLISTKAFSTGVVEMIYQINI